MSQPPFLPARTRRVERCERTRLGLKISRLLNASGTLTNEAIASRVHTLDIGYVRRLRWFHDQALAAASALANGKPTAAGPTPAPGRRRETPRRD